MHLGALHNQERPSDTSTSTTKNDCLYLLLMNEKTKLHCNCHCENSNQKTVTNDLGKFTSLRHEKGKKRNIQLLSHVDGEFYKLFADAGTTTTFISALFGGNAKRRGYRFPLNLFREQTVIFSSPVISSNF